MTTDQHTYRTNATLIDRVKNQYDEASWEEFIKTYRPFIFALAGKLGVAQHDLDDVVQRILLGLWEKLPEFELEMFFDTTWQILDTMLGQNKYTKVKSYSFASLPPIILVFKHRQRYISPFL